MDAMDVTIHLYEPRFAEAFRAINLEWIRHYFRVEQHDEDVLRDPGAIVAAGGQIFIALAAGANDVDTGGGAAATADGPGGAAAAAAASTADGLCDDPAVLGVVAMLAPRADGSPGFEFAKMGVRARARGRGVGRLLGEAAVRWARARGAAVDILSNRRLAPALALYKSLGFEERPLPANDYERADIYLVLERAAP